MGNLDGNLADGGIHEIAENQGSRFRALAQLDLNLNVEEDDMEEDFLSVNDEQILEGGDRTNNGKNFIHSQTQEIELVADTIENITPRFHPHSSLPQK